MTVVRYLATPIDLFLELQATLDALQREIQLASIDGPPFEASVVEGMVVHRETLAQVRASLYDQAVAARAVGLERADLSVEYPDDSADLVAAITTAARAVSAASAAGALLALPPRPEVRQVQDWAFGQVVGQLRGEAPTPFPGDASDGGA